MFGCQGKLQCTEFSWFRSEQIAQDPCIDNHAANVMYQVRVKMHYFLVELHLQFTDNNTALRFLLVKLEEDRGGVEKFKEAESGKMGHLILHVVI